jgi:hypothetical protein
VDISTSVSRFEKARDRYFFTVQGVNTVQADSSPYYDLDISIGRLARLSGIP